MAGKLRPETLLPKLTTNKDYIKKMKFVAKKKKRAEEEEKGYKVKLTKKKVSNSKSLSESTPKKKTAKTSGSNVSVKKGTKKTSTRNSAKAPMLKKSPKTTTAETKSIPKTKKTTANIPKAVPTAAPREPAPTKQKPKNKKSVSDKELIARVICGDESGGGALSSAAAAESQDILPYPSLPFLEDYAEQKRSEAVSAQELLRNADAYFRNFGKKESSMRRAAAKRLREMKSVNRRGGDKDGFRYVVPRNVKDVVRQMMQSAGVEGADVDPSQLVSTFGGGDEMTAEAAEAEKPMHRRKRRRSTYSDFYQFQVSKRWTRNAESFLNRGKAHKSMFEAKRQQRSIKNL